MLLYQIETVSITFFTDEFWAVLLGEKEKWEVENQWVSNCRFLGNRFNAVFLNDAQQSKRRTAGFSFAAFPIGHQVFRYVQVAGKNWL